MQIEKIMDESQPKSETPVSGLTQETAAQTFFAREERILSDLAGRSNFTFRRGDWWAIDADTGTATYDPKFFQGKGYTPSQALFASLHEVKCHLVEVAELLDSEDGNRAYQSLKQRAKRKYRVHVWENCRTDAKGNSAIRQLAPSLNEDATALYREKLFPERDLTKSPKHLQFMYAVLRESMVPDEETIVDQAVKEAINGLRNVEGRDGRTRDVIRLTTDPHLDPLLALRLSERYIEPVIDKLFAEDIEDKKQQQGQGNPQQSFADDYKDYEENIHPQPLDDEDIEKKIKEIKESQETSSREDEAYQQEHGVSIKDLADYRQEYMKVSPQIEPYKDIFRRIAEERKVIVRHLRSLKEEGVMVDPGLVAQAYVDIRSGVENPRVMRDFEGTVIPENIPRQADLYLVKDQSTSMVGDKAQAQRRGAIIETEALQEGNDILEEERLPDPLSLDINTAVIGFGVPERTKVYKALSKGLTEAQRVEIFKGLLDLGGIGTNDYDALVLIEKEIRQRMEEDPIFAEEVRLGRRKVVVIVTTDGGSNYEGFTPEQARARTKKKAGDLRELGAKVKAIALAPNGEDERNIKGVYGAEHTVVCTSADQYTESTKTVLEKDVLGPLTFTGNKVYNKKRYNLWLATIWV